MKVGLCENIKQSVVTKEVFIVEYKINWRIVFENCESESNLLSDEEGNIIFYINQYEDSILKTRKTGHLLSLSKDGEEIWRFAFPDYSYLYFTGRIGIKDGRVYTTSHSERLYDSGFERGVNLFSAKDGRYLGGKPSMVDLPKDESVCDEIKKDLAKVLGAEIIHVLRVGGFNFCLVLKGRSVEVIGVYKTIEIAGERK